MTYYGQTPPSYTTGPSYPPQPPNPAPTFGPASYGQPGATNDATAITAFVLALCSVVVWVIPALVALFLAPQAKRNIAASDGKRKGRGLATAAQIISLFTIALGALIVVLVVLLVD